MDATRPSTPLKLLTLQETALQLGVSVEVLLQWNEYHILKPTITQTGQIGYTQQQINQFLAIRASFSIPQNQIQSPAPKIDEISSQRASLPAANTKATSMKLPIPGFVPSFALLFALIAVFALTQEGKLKLLLDQYGQTNQKTTTNQTKVLGSETSTMQLSGPILFSGSRSLQNDMQQSKNLRDESESVFAKNISSPLALYGKKIANKPTASSQQKQVTNTTATRLANSLQKQTQITPQPGTNTTTQVAAINDLPNTLASTVTPCSSCTKASTETNSPIDQNGNITGDVAKTDTLAMVIGGSFGAGDNHSIQQVNLNLRNQLIIVSLGAFVLMTMLLMKRPQKVLVRAPQVQNTVSPKILEVVQKMDGTVSLYFQGKDYKISKPELDSDSDQFIERLMTLSQPNTKELEYDSFNDEIKLTVPLSRLVTRLGFVGIKRDLFFPRTSKHRVFFRKYITQEDLIAMNLTVDQIANDLTQNFSKLN